MWTPYLHWLFSSKTLPIVSSFGLVNTVRMILHFECYFSSNHCKAACIVYLLTYIQKRVPTCEFWPSCKNDKSDIIFHCQSHSFLMFASCCRCFCRSICRCDSWSLSRCQVPRFHMIYTKKCAMIYVINISARIIM